MFLVLGMGAGFLSGLLGIGGGALVVPGLLWIFTVMRVPDYDTMVMAAATSLMILVFTSLSTVYWHLRRQNVVGPVFVRMSIWILLGVLCGASLASRMAPEILRLLFALFLLAIWLKLLLKLRPRSLQQGVRPMRTRIVAVSIGLLSGLLGVGGGTLSVPYLLHCQLPMNKAVGTTALVTLWVAGIGAAVFGFADAAVPVSWTTGYIYWPAVLCVAPCSIVLTRLGAQCGQALNAENLRRIFALILLVLSIKMLW